MKLVTTCTQALWAWVSGPTSRVLAGDGSQLCTEASELQKEGRVGRQTLPPPGGPPHLGAAAGADAKEPRAPTQSRPCRHCMGDEKERSCVTLNTKRGPGHFASATKMPPGGVAPPTTAVPSHLTAEKRPACPGCFALWPWPQSKGWHRPFPPLWRCQLGSSTAWWVLGSSAPGVVGLSEVSRTLLPPGTAETPKFATRPSPHWRSLNFTH